MHVALKLDDNGCRIHGISDDVPSGPGVSGPHGNEEIVTSERYLVMPWKIFARHGTNMTLKEAVDRILNKKESENKELGIRKREKEHMKEEMERLNELVDWYKCKLKEISEAPVDSKPRKLEKLYQRSEKNKDLGVTITRAGILALVDYPNYPPKLELPEDNEEIVFCDAPTASSLAAGYKSYNQLDYFKKLIKAYNGYDSDAIKHVKR